MPMSEINRGTPALGKDFLLEVKSAAGEWVLIGGQRSADMQRAADKIDITTKNSGGWCLSKIITKSWSVDLSGLVILVDAGVSILTESWHQSQKIKIRLRHVDDSVFVGEAYLTDFNLTAPHDGAAELSGTIEGVGALFGGFSVFGIYDGGFSDSLFFDELDGGKSSTTNYTGTIDGGTSEGE